MNKKTIKNLIIASSIGILSTSVCLTITLASCSNINSEDSKGSKVFTTDSINNFKQSINSYINNKSLTEDEFNSSLLEIVKSNLSINNRNIGNLVESVEFSNQNEMQITLNSIEYSIDDDVENSLATLNKSVSSNKSLLSIKFEVLNFYSLISIDNNTLINLRNSILNDLNNSNNFDNIDEFERYFQSNIVNQINNLETNLNNTKLSNYINTPVYSPSSKSINISLNRNKGLYKFANSSSNDIQVTNDEIILNNIVIDRTLASPESWFTWNGDEITGLSDLGKNQSSIVLPSRAKLIKAATFYNNETLVSIDMSLTQITDLPSAKISSFPDGMFEKCINLRNVVLPETLKSIDEYAFERCASLTNINFPDSLKSIEQFAFYGCTSLKTIVLPANISEIGFAAFINCSNIKSIDIKNSSSITIQDRVFDSCINLNSINFLCSSINFVKNGAADLSFLFFNKVPSTCVATARTETVRSNLKYAKFPGTIK